MFAFWTYMIKSAVALLLFYICFKALLSRETFFSMNRFMLLGGLFICMLLPWVPLSISGDVLAVRERYLPFEELKIKEKPVKPELIDLSVLAVTDASETETTDSFGQEEIGRETTVFSWLMFGMWVYCIGGVLVLGWLLISFGRMRKLMHGGKHQKLGKYTLILVEVPIAPFSWGNRIVMNEGDFRENSEHILIHEQIHADKKHTLDLLLIELVLIFQWFNPVVWLLKRELQELHEYEADKGVLDQGIDATKYQLLLVKKAVGVRLYSLANSFNHSKLKNRITMMLKEKSNHWARLKVLLLTPLAALLMLAFARPEEITDPELYKVTQIPDNPEVYLLKEGKDPVKHPMMFLGMNVKTKLDSVKELFVTYSMNSEKNVNEIVKGIQKGYGMYNKILNAVIGIWVDSPNPHTTAYARQLEMALKERGVKDIKYQYYGTAATQKVNHTPWTQQFFTEEMKKNGGDKYRLNMEELRDNFGDGYLMILINAKGTVAFADKLVPQDQVKDQVSRFLAKHLDGTSFFITLQKDVHTPAEAYQEVLNALGEAYQEVRSNALSQGVAPEKLDSVCPIRLGFIPDKVFRK